MEESREGAGSHIARQAGGAGKNSWERFHTPLPFEDSWARGPSGHTDLGFFPSGTLNFPLLSCWERFTAVCRGPGGKVPWCPCCSSHRVICRGSDWAVCNSHWLWLIWLLTRNLRMCVSSHFLISWLLPRLMFGRLQKTWALAEKHMAGVSGSRLAARQERVQGEGRCLLALQLLGWGGRLCLHASHILGEWQGRKPQGRSWDTIWAKRKGGQGQNAL